MGIRNILFDLDNTLLDFNKAERKALTGTLQELGITPSETIFQRYSQLNLAQWKLLEQEKITRNQVKVRRYQLLFDELGLDCSARKAAQIYERYLGIGHFFVDGAEALLEDLSLNYRLYLVTNGTASVQKGRIQSAKIERFFNGIFISEEIGFDKPNKAFFDHCFLQIPDFQKEETILVGDSLSSDIQGGKNAGIATVWFNPSHMEKDYPILPDYEIQTLAELTNLLERGPLS